MAAADDIRELLTTYQRSLNQADAAAAALCYTPDGLFVPNGAPTVTADKLNAMYEALFGRFDVSVEFVVDDLTAPDGAFAFAVTHSSNTQTARATGETKSTTARQLFVFRKRDGAWKISHYMTNVAASTS